jgi:carboxylesterase
MIIPTTEPFFFPGRNNAPGILLTHGFTGTPKEMRWMGEYLNQKHGFTCLGVRLTGHATRPEDMIRSRYTDWLASVEDGFHLLAGAAPRVYLAGLSMGGVLSLLAASSLPVHGVIAMATPYNLPEGWPCVTPACSAASSHTCPNPKSRPVRAGSTRMRGKSTSLTRKTRCAPLAN